VRDPLARLDDISEAIANIERHAPVEESQFAQDEFAQTWILRQLQNIGEAVNHLPPEWLAEYPDIPWGEIVGMRNRIVHGYFGIRLDVIWSAATIGLPALKRAVESLRAAHTPPA